MAKKFKLRFNLGRGDNYLKWKVTTPKGTARYYEPSEVTIFMSNCKLINQKVTAQKIYDGAHKTVCAWVEADDIVIYHKMPDDFVQTVGNVTYNPRVEPNWVLDGEDVDKEKYEMMVTKDRKIFIQ